MDDKLTAALIAAIVSVLISAIGFVSSWFALQAKRNKLERQIRTGYMSKLYERRLDLYPKVFEITRGLNRPPKGWEPYKREELLLRRQELLEWMNGPSGLIMSQPVIRASYDLLDCLGANFGEKDTYSRAQMEKLIATATKLRSEVRADVRFLHLSDESRERDVG